MTRAYSMRIPDDLLRRAKNRCAESGVSLTAFVVGAIEARLEAPSLLDQPMVPVLAPRETDSRIAKIADEYLVGVTGRGLASHLAGEHCAHPFRDNPCGVCGQAW